jgi:hypothetical protein
MSRHYHSVARFFRRSRNPHRPWRARLILEMLEARTVMDTVTLKSDATILAAALGPGGPSRGLVERLDTADATGLSLVPVAVGSYGTYTPIPPGAPAGTTVVNIPPGDGENGYFEMTFTLPSNFSNITLTGSANVDDTGRAFLNGNPISPSILGGGLPPITEFGNVTFSTQDAAYFIPGENTILISDANTGGGPSGGAFFLTITYSSAAPDLVANFLRGDIHHAGVDFQYTLTGAQLPKDTTAQFFLASGTTTDTILAPATPPIPIPQATLVDQPVSLHLAPADFRGPAPDDARYLLGWLDPENLITESRKDNNVASIPIHGADLVPLVDGDIHKLIYRQQELTVHVSILNQGDQPARGHFELRYYLSQNQDLDSTDDDVQLTVLTPLANNPLSLEAGGLWLPKDDIKVAIPDTLTEGTYFLKVQLSSPDIEENTTNNIVVAGPLQAPSDTVYPQPSLMSPDLANVYENAVTIAKDPRHTVNPDFESFIKNAEEPDGQAALVVYQDTVYNDNEQPHAIPAIAWAFPLKHLNATTGELEDRPDVDQVRSILALDVHHLTLEQVLAGAAISLDTAQGLYELAYTEALVAARAVFTGFDSLPQSQQTALLSLTYDLGDRVATKFPRLVDYVNRGEYALAGWELVAAARTNEVGAQRVTDEFLLLVLRQEDRL